MPGRTALVVATLDDEPTARPAMHINIESKAPWYEICDDLPQFSALPPGLGSEADEQEG